MSEQRGLIKLRGNLGGISFFESDGQHLARMANGPDKNRINKDPRFQRTRENNMEFGGSAMAAKAFRHAFAPVMSMADTRFTGRLTGIFKEINTKGDGLRGQRAVSVFENKVLLANVEFNQSRSVNSLFTGLYTAANVADRTSGTITLTDVLLRRATKAPEGATHVVFTQALGVVSDYVYDAELKRYTPADAALDKLSSITDSEFIALNSAAPLTLTLNTVLPGNPVLTEKVSVVQCFSVAFYQQVKDDYYPLLQGSAIKVVRVF